jgi:two-component system chemotaxis response regulator CheB
MPPGFTGPFAKRLNSLCRIQVREAKHGDTIEPGIVFIAPAGSHATLGRKSHTRATIYLSEHPAGTLHRPPVDVTMLSAAEEFGRATMGIIMTGMGSDGLEGMTAIHKAGGVTIGQDELTSAVYGMPRCCAERGILESVVPLDDLPRHLLHALRQTSQ